MTFFMGLAVCKNYAAAFSSSLLFLRRRRYPRKPARPTAPSKLIEAGSGIAEPWTAESVTEPLLVIVVPARTIKELGER